MYLSDHAGRFMELPQELTGMKLVQKLQVIPVEGYWCRAAYGTHQNIRHMAATLITWIPLGIFSQLLVLGWTCKQLKPSQKYGGNLSENVVDTFPSHLTPLSFWPQFFCSATCSFQLGCGSMC